MKLLALVLVSMAFSLTHSTNGKAMSAATACPGHVQGVYFYREATRSWERKMGHKPSKSNFNASLIHSCKYTVWTAHHWAKRAKETKKQYEKFVQEQRQSLYGKWECIHRYEGAWNANTGNGYYGGLQMDMDFQSRYGAEYYRRWGTADNWPVWAQLQAAENAYQSGRGFYPWPNTARACGLI